MSYVLSVNLVNSVLCFVSLFPVLSPEHELTDSLLLSYFVFTVVYTSFLCTPVHELCTQCELGELCLRFSLSISCPFPRTRTHELPIVFLLCVHSCVHKFSVYTCS